MFAAVSKSFWATWTQFSSSSFNPEFAPRLLIFGLRGAAVFVPDSR